MDITPLVADDSNIINSYGDGGFTVNKIRYNNSIFITPNLLIELSDIKTFAELKISDLEKIISYKEPIDILLIGTGEKHFFIPPEIKNFSLQNNINCETMNTGAASRTYNVLLTEERKVAAFLIAI